eukprot:CAMPEP_0194395538 /NCGR_PEP_ID=MMETSP0174-20130528/124479_1 /TAXON_ID=216777 /ORGANISM="Proboscia alata, Strain PI-D3" /LENGTH=153 /DNA_ID=CAMNT_0039191485 /DNA_START=937 /DNA_END=1398 /DNA_ORIENTATION=-
MEATLSAIKFNLGSVLWDGDGKWFRLRIPGFPILGNNYPANSIARWVPGSNHHRGEVSVPMDGSPPPRVLQHKSPPSIFLSGFRIQSGLGMDSSPTWDVRNPSGMAVGGGVGLLLSTVKFGPRVYVGLTDVAPMEAQFDQEAHGTRVCRAQMG